MSRDSSSSTTMRRRSLLAGGAGAIVLAGSGCAGPGLDDYRDTKPLLDLRRYFDGPLRAHGMFADRSGRVMRRFTVAMACRWQGNDGVLDEDFVYDDGEKQKRIWRLSHLGDGRYSGRADDVVGDAQGATSGHAFQWRYTMRLPWRSHTIDVDFDDWMFLVDDRVMLNRATMSKFGIRLGEVQLAFDKAPASSTRSV
jgi:Protein of unknown function (DUF3833)